MSGPSLGARLTVAASLTALAVLAVSGALSLRAHRRSLLAEVERHADQLGEAVKAGAEYDMMFNQRDRLQRGFESIGARPGISRVRLVNKAGVVIYSSDPAEVGRGVDMKGESCTMCHSNGRPRERVETARRARIFVPVAGGPRMLGLINPVYNQPSCSAAACHVHPANQRVLGVLDVVLPLEEVDRDIRRAGLEAGVQALAAVAALSLILGFLVRRWVAGPVAALVDATRRVAGGELDATLEPGGDDELGALARAFNDMTRRLSEARLQLFQSDKLASVGRLAAGVAHEINNPLTGVLTYASFLVKRTADRPEIRRDLEVIVRETVRCREIVRCLLDFARQSVPRKARTDLNAVIRRAVAVVERPLAVRKAELALELDPALPEPVVDGNQLQQVFINLLVNAADSLGEGGGRITVRTGAEDVAEGRFVKASVTDTGCGIPPEARARLFEPFYTTKGQKGTGLGLSVIWGIVENHGGSITVESETGAGATFTVRVPVGR